MTAYSESDLHNSAKERLHLPFHLVEHSLAFQALRIIRDQTTPPDLFSAAISTLTNILIVEATSNLPLDEVVIQTPLAEMTALELKNKTVLVPIMRAGLGMLESTKKAFLPSNIHSILFAGVKRDEATAMPLWYREIDELPDLNSGSNVTFLILDPMLATGGSSIDVATKVKEKYPHATIKMVGIIGAPEGVTALNQAHPDVEIFLAALDDHLNEKSYIVPGLGDAGDRQFGTL